jgi:hypothetical protein
MEQFFGIYDGELDAGFCQDIIRRFEGDDRKVQGMGGHGNGGIVDRRAKATSEVLLWTHSDGWEDVNEAIATSLRTRLREYLSEWGQALQLGIYPEEPRVTRYNLGDGFLAWHADNVGRSPTRVITAIWYLNTVQEGGETWYTSGRRRLFTPSTGQRSRKASGGPVSSLRTARDSGNWDPIRLPVLPSR